MTQHTFDFPKNGGITGSKIRSGELVLSGYDSPDQWPVELRAVLNFLLSSLNPALIIIPEPLTVLQNDAMRLSENLRAELADHNVKHIIAQLNTGKEAVETDSRFNILNEFNASDIDRFSFTAIEDQNGKLIAIAGIHSHCPDKVPHFVDQFNSLMEQVPVGITMFSGPNFIVDMANDRYLELVDRKRAEFIGRPLLHSLPEVVESVEELLRSVYETGIPFVGTEFPVYLFRHGVKERCFFNFNYLPRKNGNGDIDGIIVVAYETTDMVKGKKFLEESEHEFRRMVMQSPIGMTIFKGEDFVIDIANEKLARDIWRLPLEDVIGKKVLDVFPELNDQKYPELLKKVLAEGGTHIEKESVAFVNGSDGMRKFYLDFQYSPLRSVDNTISGVIIAVDDVTQQVELRQKTEERAEAFRLLAESTPQMVWSGPADGTTDFYNKSILEYTGLTNDQLLKETIGIAVHPDDKESGYRLWTNSITNGTDFYVEHRLRNAKGEYRWHVSRAVPVRDYKGEIQSWVGSSTDIHSHKELNTELEKQVHERTGELEKINVDLEKMNRELQSFAYISSHDLQEPLRKIQMFSSRIMQMDYDRLSDNGRHYFNRMGMAAGRMQLLLDDLLSYSRTSAGDKRLAMVDMSSLFNEVVEDLEEELRQKNAVVNSKGLCEVMGVDFQIRQLFYNLISNSLKFAKPSVDPVINVESKLLTASEANKPGDRFAKFCHIIFSDNGIGFDPQYNEKVFGFFQRLNDKEAYLGSGMGLAIVKKIVENHEGYVEASGIPGEGAKFDIYLPVRE